MRVLNLLALLGVKRRTLDEMAAETGVSTRTIRRDLAAIEEAYLPLTDVMGSDRQRRWRLEQFSGRSVTTLMSGRQAIGVRG